MVAQPLRKPTCMLAAMLGGPRRAADAHKICLHGLRGLKHQENYSLKVR
jgi:hypothetical protein